MKGSDETMKNRQTEENDERNLQTKSKFLFSVIESRESRKNEETNQDEPYSIRALLHLTIRAQLEHIYLSEPNLSPCEPNYQPTRLEPYFLRESGGLSEPTFFSNISNFLSEPTLDHIRAL